MKEIAVTFTGHRTIPTWKQKRIKEKIKIAISRLYARGYRRYYCGMAMGFDMMAAEVVLSLKGSLCDVELIAIVPFHEQSYRYSCIDKCRYDEIISNADEVRELYPSYFKGCFLRRNDYMISNSSLVIAYYDGKIRGGTFYTCRKAEAKGMEVINIYT